MTAEKHSEQDRWKIDGDCKKCRRQKYCTKECRKFKERIRKKILDKITKGKVE